MSAVSTQTFTRLESNVRSYSRVYDFVVASARGSVITDTAGNDHIDFLAAAGSLNYGHNDPDLKAALIDYIDRDGIACGLDMFTEAKLEFLDTFEELVLRPRRMDHVVQFTGPTGTSAVESALKLARRVTGRSNVICFTNAFHGMSQGALAATGSSHHRMAPRLPLHGVTRMPYDGYLGDGVDTSDYLARLLDDASSGVDAPAAILLETVQGEGGLTTASAPWLQRIARLAAEHGALLIVDDVQAGCGRTGSFFSFEGLGVMPDLIVLSKSLSGYGLPMSVLLIRPEWDAWLPGQDNGTFRGNGHAFVTASAALVKFWSDDRLMSSVAARGGRIGAALGEIARMCPGALPRGRGLMRGLRLEDPELASAVRRTCLDRGLIVECCGPQDEVVKLLPPLTTPDELLDEGLVILRLAVMDVVDVGYPVSA
jgi:diaminobutyrate-2-oxoglutarate transaminase